MNLQSVSYSANVFASQTAPANAAAQNQTARQTDENPQAQEAREAREAQRAADEREEAKRSVQAEQRDEAPRPILNTSGQQVGSLIHVIA